MGRGGSDIADLDVGGSDVFAGGKGIDSVRPAGDVYAASIVIDLASGHVSSAEAGGVGNDIVYSVESAYGADGDDRLTGNAANNRLVGGGGDDEIYGLDGDDKLNGSWTWETQPSGTDLLDGGAGSDRCRFGATVLNCEAVFP
jgi:Ca2+-binding RTX toxin-like protein